MTTSRAQPPNFTPTTYLFGRFVLDVERARLVREGEEVKLRPKSFELLRYFVEHRDRVLTKDELIKAVWPDAFVTDDSLVQCVKEIRRALKDDQQEYVKTVPKRGYIFEVPAKAKRDAAIATIADREETQRIPVAVKEQPSIVEANAERNESLPPRRRVGRWIGASLVVASAVAGLLASFPKVRNGPASWRPVPFTSYRGAERNPALSPDGNKVAFTWNGNTEDNFDIYIQSIGSSNPQRLTNDPAEDSSPEWSPDGRSIAFLRRLDADRNQVILIPSIGGPEHVLAETLNKIIAGRSSVQKNLAWTPDGQWVVVPHRGNDQSATGFSLVSVVTGDKRQLTQPTAGYFDENPAFSSDGLTLAFARHASAFVSDLYVQPLSKDFVPTGPVKRLTTDGRAAHPVWTSDERLIYRDLASESLRMTGRWSFDLFDTGSWGIETSGFSLGRHLVFVQAGTDTNVWRAQVSPSEAPPSLPQLFISSTRHDTNPQFSPDGKEIAFISHRSGSAQIWISSADGSNPVQRTFFDGPVYFPNWSPNGQRILFHTRVNGQADLFSIPAAGGQANRLTTDPSEEVVGSYSRDGNSIYFSSNRAGPHEVWRMPAEGGEAKQITFGGGYLPQESPDGKTLFYVRGDSEMTIWKIPVQGGTALQVTGPIARDPAFAVSQDGIYYKVSTDSPARQVVQFLSFSTGKIRPVVITEREIGLGMSLSPDGRHLIFAQRDRASDDLMLVENFSALIWRKR